MKWPHRLRLLAIGALALAIASGWFVLPLQEWIANAVDALRGTGAWAPWILLALYATTGVLAVPASFLSMAAGFMFGLGEGALIAWCGSLLGATGAYLAGRTLARRGVANWMERNPRFRTLDHALGRNGLKVVMLLRLSPVFPGNVLNYLFGVSHIAPWRFMLGTAVGGLPLTLLHVYVGTAVRRLTDRVSHPTLGPADSQWVLLALGIVASALAVAVIGRIARQALDEAVAEEDGEEKASNMIETEAGM